MAVSRPIGVRTLCITVVIVFLGTTAVLLWRARNAGPEARGPAAARLAAAPRTGARSPAFAAATLAASGPQPGQDRGSSATGGPLPVRLFFHRRLIHNDPRHRGLPSFVMDARIYNDSPEPLSVEMLISDSSLQTARQIMLDIGPHGLRDLGADDGVQMHAQDVITLRSPPFSDLVTQIR